MIKMPPSGYNQNAINAILEITKFEYEKLFAEYDKSNLKEDEFLNGAIGKLEVEIGKEELAPSISRNIKIFMAENLKDLVNEIYLGKDKLDRSVVNGYAIQKEITQISDYLKKLKI